MTELSNQQVLSQIAEDPGRFDAQRYWDENPDIQAPFSPSGRNDIGDKWTTTWGSFTGQGGREIGGALTHFIRNGAEEGRQGYVLDERDETYNDPYAQEFMTSVPTDDNPGNDITLARMYDLGLVHNAGQNSSGQTKLRFSWEADALPDQKASLWGEANQSLYQGIAGLYTESGVDPTLETMKLLPAAMQGMNLNADQTASVNRFINENVRALTEQAMPTGDDIAASAQAHIDGGPLGSFEDALAATLLGGEGATFTGGENGQEYQVPDGLASFVERANLPELPDPFEGIDPETGLTYDELRRVRELQVKGEIAIHNSGTVLGSTQSAVQAALAQNPVTVDLSQNPWGIGESPWGALGTMASAVLPGAGALGSLADATIDKGIVSSIFQQAGIGNAEDLSIGSDFFSNMSWGAADYFGASNMGTQAAAQMLAQGTSPSQASVISQLPRSDVTAAMQAMGISPTTGLNPYQMGLTGPTGVPHQILPGSTPYNPSASAWSPGTPIQFGGTIGTGAPITPVQTVPLPPVLPPTPARVNRGGFK